jgi:hypothetical protein
MDNTLIQDNFDELLKLTKEDRNVVIQYFNNWSESYPAYFEDNDTLQEKMEKSFIKWFNENHDMESFTAEDVMEYHNDGLNEMASLWEYEVDTILSYYKGEYDEELFKELVEEYLAEQE